MISTTSRALADAEARRLGDTPSSLLRQRIQAEFVEMPGLTLTLPQAARLWGLTTSQAEAVLTNLADSGFLARDPHGSYRRHGCPRCS